MKVPARISNKNFLFGYLALFRETKQFSETEKLEKIYKISQEGVVEIRMADFGNH